MSKVIVSVVQAGTPLFDTARTLQKAEHFCRQASAAGARLVVFPEAFVGGYPKGNYIWRACRLAFRRRT
jgi:nitrilase